MNEEKKSTGNASKKSSRATAQKSPGEKLKNEQSARKAVREKLRYDYMFYIDLVDSIARKK